MRIAAAITTAVIIAACGTGASDGPPSAPGVVGQWELVDGTVDGDPFPIVDGFRITLNVEAGGTLGGTAACNGYGAAYVADGEDLLVQEISSTAMACQPAVMESEQAFMAFLGRPIGYERVDDRLVLRSDGYELTFEAVAPVPTEELIGTEWLLTSLVDGDRVTSVAGAPATLLLTDGGAIVGSTGCRALQGQYVVNADQVLFTTFSAIGECPQTLADQDGFVVTVLGDGFRAAIEGSRLTVTSSGNEGLVYTKRQP